MHFIFENKYILEDSTVLLRPLELSDFNNLLPFALHEAYLWKYSLLSIYDKESLETYLNYAVQHRNDSLEYPFIVFDKRTNAYAGSTRFYDISFLHKTLKIGYTWYGKDFQGTGLNKHAKFLLLDFAFEKMGMERVEFRADNNNERSIAAIKSLGASLEGVLRSSEIKPDNTRRDSAILSILKNEWYGSLRENLLQKLS